ncbi:DUF5694 domain-containing protein [Pedobacter sp. SYP-B3415]|uniref:DUF5694 domain-containing protein n=1 Tax=Pedobacter sp. SYP-B3415 TaxID=2496641 RepID=UPI00101C6505|nr:DUF5694 domain-containing protein [Pedobacter sp. SYP-B3415]
MKISTPSFLLVVLCSLFFVNAYSQQIEIVVVGSSHDNPQGSENFAQVVSKLKKFKPDMVFGEYSPAGDFVQLESDNWARKAFARGQTFMNRQFGDAPGNLTKKISGANRELRKSPNGQGRLRMDLASWYAANNDRANTEYQVFVVENYMKKTFAEAERMYYDQHFLHQDSLKSARLFRPKSEYTTIFFPLVYELGLDGIDSMDCQKFDKPWSKAWGETDSLIRVLEKQAKADTTSQLAHTLKELERLSNLTDEDKKNMHASEYANMNTDRYAELNDAWNFYGGPQAFDLPGFPAASARRMYAEWTNRNEGMCANVIRQARASKAKRVVVGVGAAHRKIMADMLARNRDVKIVSYNDL